MPGSRTASRRSRSGLNPAGRLRRNAPDGTYQVAADGKLWQVDEKANRATVQPSPYHGENHELNLLALVPELSDWDRAMLSKQHAVGRDAHNMLVYRMQKPGPQGQRRARSAGRSGQRFAAFSDGAGRS